MAKNAKRIMPRLDPSILQAIFERQPGGVLVCDEQGNLLAMNNAQRAQFESAGLDVQVGQFNVLTDPLAFEQGLAQEFRKAYQTGQVQSVRGLEWSTLQAASKAGWSTSQSTPTLQIEPVVNREGRVIATVAFAEKVTEVPPASEAFTTLEREEAEATIKELERSNLELRQFAYTASHDLQEPLRVIQSYTQELGKQLSPEAKGTAASYLRQIENGVQRMQQLTSGLLEYAHIDFGNEKAQSTPVQVALQAALDNLRRLIETNEAQIVVGDLPHVIGHSTQLTQLFQNLIGNSLKFRSEETPRLQVTALRAEPGFWKFSVADNGLGIAPKERERVFQMFTRLHSHEFQPGYGIGLALCKRIVESHGGTIWLEPAPGRGTTFSFTLRDAETLSIEEIEQAMESGELLPAWSRNHLLLVVDDNRSIGSLTSMTLRQAGYQVAFATNPEEARSQAEKLSPALAILDVHMPGLSGPELAYQLQETLPGLKILYLSGDASQEKMAQESQSSFLEKGTNPTTLVKTIDSMLMLEK